MCEAYSGRLWKQELAPPIWTNGEGSLLEDEDRVQSPEYCFKQKSGQWMSKIAS
jgi:hypothetical protein